MRPLLLAFLLSISFLPGAGRASEDAVWALLREGGHVVLVRHAQTDPGVGDPEGMRLDDCSTQRNLSAAGREQARELGAAFRRFRVPVGEVLSSPWCRCVETAQLAFGRAEPAPMLGNLFGRPERRAEQVEEMRAFVGAARGEGSPNAVLVTHGTTIYALTGSSAAMGEMVVLRPLGEGRFSLAGRLRLP